MNYKILKYSRYHPGSDNDDNLNMYEYFQKLENINNYIEGFPEPYSLLYISDINLNEIELPFDLVQSLYEKIKDIFPVEIDWEHPNKFFKKLVLLHKIIIKTTSNKVDFKLEGIPEKVLDKIFDKISKIFDTPLDPTYKQKEKLADLLGYQIKEQEDVNG